VTLSGRCRHTARTTRAPRPATLGRMPELSRFTSAQAQRARTVRIAELARRQHGVVSWAQLRAGGFTERAISNARRAGRLIAVHPRVYAVGHKHLDVHGWIWAALLYVGKGAALSHTTAAWLWRLLETVPRVIHVSAPGRVGSVPGVVVHHPRHLHVVTHEGMPVTAVGRTLVDTAGMLGFDFVRKAIANASFRSLLPPGEAVSALKRGRRGSAAVRRALGQMLPELAHTVSPLEDLFVIACDTAGLPAPEMNRYVLGFKVDAIWRDMKIIVELDGGQAHGHSVAVHVDRERDLALRRAGWTVLRYSRQQIESDWPAVVAELRSYLCAPELSRGTSADRK
jgi:predicted transcriptional regulator of viral defense system